MQSLRHFRSPIRTVCKSISPNEIHRLYGLVISLHPQVSRRASSPLEKNRLPKHEIPATSLLSHPSTSSPTPTISSASRPSNSSLNGSSNIGPGRPPLTLPPVSLAPVTLPRLSESENENPTKCDETPSCTPPLSLSINIPSLDPTCVAARCRPIKSYRRRKLLRMSGLHNLSRKAARPVTLSCSCWPPSATHRGGYDYR